MKIRIKIATVLSFILLSANTVLATPLGDVSRDLVNKEGSASVVEGVDGWLFFKEELRHVAAGRFWGEASKEVTRAKNKKYADPLPAILNYNKKLAENGITLYLMPVPPKVLVYPDKVAENLPVDIAAPDHQLYTDFYAQLEEAGVHVIDMLPALLEARKDKQVYCKTDTHFSGEGISLFAEVAAELIKKEVWYPEIAKTEFTKTLQTVSIRGDLSQMMESDKESQATVDSEELELSIVKAKETNEAVQSDVKSRVILLGDSHTLVFSAGGDLHAKGAGLFDHLSANLGFAVDLLGVRGSGVTPARIKLYQRSKKDSSYLEGKKILIWCFTARDFTGTGGWRDIPVAP